ncbi:glycosyltransferase [Rhizobiaceae bacterium]|nr:glycosyltransferase [Rhizobiaceae bacterium]
MAHVTLQPVENDARVQRAVEGLEQGGFSCPLTGPGYGFDLPTFDTNEKAKVAVSFAAAARLGVRAARYAFFAFPHHRRAVDALIAAKPDAIHAHDWDGLLLGAEAACRLGVPFAYDSHEFAAHLHSSRRMWRASVGALIHTLEPTTSQQAAFVVAVSQAHAYALRDHLKLREVPTVVRNIPKSPSVPYVERPATNTVLLHYHGAIAAGRGVEMAIRALARLPDRYSLRLTGPCNQVGFKRDMLALMETLAVRSRVEVHPALPHEQLVDHASSADIGLCMLPEGDPHNEIAMPNKVFEYLKAGLPFITSGVRYMDFALDAGAARLLEEATPEAVASIILSIDDDLLRSMRLAASTLGRTLRWETEAEALVRRWSRALN